MSCVEYWRMVSPCRVVEETKEILQEDGSYKTVTTKHYVRDGIGCTGGIPSHFNHRQLEMRKLHPIDVFRRGIPGEAKSELTEISSPLSVEAGETVLWPVATEPAPKD